MLLDTEDVLGVPKQPSSQVGRDLLLLRMYPSHDV